MRWEVVGALRRGLALGALLCFGGMVPALAQQGIVQAAVGLDAASPEARALATWVRESRNPGGRPYAIVDKARAQLHVFDAQGHLVGSTAALLGSTPGDHTVPGVGLRTQVGQVGVDERTTPAGRFDAMPGRNLKGEHVVWVDYASAFAIHRLRPGASFAARQARLESATPDDNRVSYGCVVVPVAFYASVVEPVLGSGKSVVYVLPETRPLQQLLQEL
jgi:primosomal protein N'